MEIQKITEFRPSPNSGSAGMRAAVERIVSEKAAAEAALADAIQRRGKLLLSAGPAEVARNDANTAELRVYLDQLDAMQADLAPRAEAAADSERAALAEYQERQVKLASRSAAWAKGRTTKYAPAAKNISAWLEEEREIIREKQDQHRRRAELIAAGIDLPPVLPPFAETVGPLMHASFGDMVRLPGIEGAPGIPIDMTPVRRSVQVRRPDWDAGGPTDSTGKPLATKLVSEQISEISPRPIRDDVPFWPPK